MGKGRFTALSEHWGKFFAGVFALAIGVFSLNSVNESMLQANLLAGDPTSAQPSANVEIYDLAADENIVFSGDLIPMLAVDFTSGGGSLDTVGITVMPDQASLFTDTDTASEIFANGASSTLSSWSSFVVIRDDGDDILTAEDAIIPSDTDLSWSVSGNNASLTWTAPETLSNSVDSTYFLALQLDNSGFKDTHDGTRFRLRLDSLTGFTGADNLSAVQSSEVFLDLFRPKLKGMVFDGAPGNGTNIDFVFDQTMNPGGNVSTQLLEMRKEDGSVGSFGSGASAALATTDISNDTLRITMGTSHDFDNIDSIYFNITNSHGQSPNPTFPSLMPPQLVDVFVDDDDDDNKFESAGDMMFLFFDTAMDPASCNFAAATNCFTFSQGSVSTNSYIYWPAEDMAVIRLTADNAGQSPAGGTIKPTTNLENIRGLQVDSEHPTKDIDAPNDQFPRAENIYVDFVDNPGDPVINENTMGTLHWEYSPDDVNVIEGMEILLLPAEFAGTVDIDAAGYTPINTPASISTQIVDSGQATLNFATYAAQVQQDDSSFFMGYDSLTTLDDNGNIEEISYIEPFTDYRYHILTCNGDRDNGGEEGGGEGGGGPSAAYSADFNGQGNASLLRMEFGSDLDTSGSGNPLGSCPELGMGDENYVCYDTANSVDVSAANLADGVSVYAVYVDPTDNARVAYVILSGNSGNGLNDVGGTVTFKSGYAGEGIDTDFTIASGGGGGGGGEEEGIECTVSSSAPFQYVLGGSAVFDFVQVPFIIDAFPGFNSVVPTNVSAINVQFSDPMDPTTINTSSVTLRNTTADSDVSGSVSYHAGSQMVVFSPDSSLASNSEFQLRFDENTITSNLEIPINSNTQVSFRTNSSTDSTDPTVFYTSAQGSGVSTLEDIVFQFSEAMDVSTLTSSNITVSPGIVGTFKYEVGPNALIWTPNQELSASQSYTISLSSSVTDIAGNSIDTGNDEFTFTTGSADNTDPDVNWVEAKETWIRIGLNTPPSKSTITGDAKDNIVLKCNSVPVSTGFADVIMEPDNVIRIDNLQLTAANECTLNFGSQAKARNGQSLKMDTPFSFDVESDFGGYGTGQFGAEGFVDDDFVNFGDLGFAQDWGQFDSDNYENRADDPFFAAVSPIIVDPFNKRAGATTDVFVSFPITRRVTHGDKIIIKGFPLGTNLTSAAMSDDPINDNIIIGGATLSDTDYNGALITISNVTYKASSGALELTVAIDADADGSVDSTAKTYPAATFEFILSDIVNSSNSTNNDFATAGGLDDNDRPEIEVKTSQGQLVEEIGKAEPVFIEQAGTNTITGQARTTGNAALQNAFCELWSYSGVEIKKTDSNGDCAFSNLPDGFYDLMIAAPYGYMEVFTSRGIDINGGDSKSHTQKFARAEHQLTGTISHPSFDENTNIDIIVSGDRGTTVCQVTATAGQSSTGYTCYGSEGFNFVTLAPGFDREALFMEIMDNPFNPPLGKEISMDANETLNWTITAPSQTIEGKVVDGNGQGIPNVNVFAFERVDVNRLAENDFGFGGAETRTRANGTFTLRVDDNRTYNVGVDVYGKYKEKTITLTNGTQSVSSDNFTFKMGKPSQSIKGSCLFDSKPTPCEINAFSDQGTSARAYSGGEDGYTLFVDDGEWTLDAFSFEKGYLGQATVTVDGDNHTGQNFSVGASDVKTVEGTVQVGGSALANANVWIERYNTSTQAFLDGRPTVTDADGGFSINISALGSGQAYRAFIDHPEYGGFPPQNNLTDSDTGSNSINLGSMNTVTFVVDGADDLSINHGFINMFEPSNDTFAGKPIERSNGSLDGSYTLQVPDGTYEVVAFMDRFGEIEPAEGGEITISDDTTLNFNEFDSVDFITVTVTVEDGNESALAGAEVAMFGDGRFASGQSNGSGQVTLSLPEPSEGKSYKLGARLGGYMSPSPLSVNTSVSRTITLDSADSTITGTVSTANGNTGDAFVYATCDDGSRSETFSEDTGEYTVAVPAGTSCNINVTTANGFKDAITGISAGSSSANISATGTAAYVKHFETKKTTMDLATGGTVSVSDSDAAFDEVELKIPTGALASSSANGSVTGKAAAPPVTETAQPLAAIDLTARNSSTGTAITSATKDMTLVMALDKENIDELVTDNVMTYDDLTDVQNSYYDSSSGYTTLATTLTCRTQAESGDSFAATDCDTVATNVQGDSSYYNDYKVTLTSTVDHFTVFAPVIGAGEGGGGGRQTGVFGYVEGIVSSDPITSSEEGQGSSVSEAVDDAAAAEEAEESGDEVMDEVYVMVDDEAGTVTQLVPPQDTYAVDLQDIDGHWAYEPINNLASRGILSGYDNGDFRPNQSMTRAELVKVAVRAMELPVLIEPSAAGLGFADVKDTDWFLPYVYAAVEEGLIEGRIRFRPHDFVNRAEALKILLLASGADLDNIPAGFVLPFADVARDSWYRPHVKYAFFFGVVGGYVDDGMRYFDGNSDITRAEVSKLVTELFDFDAEEPEIAEDDEGETDGEDSDGENSDDVSA